jgi:hypothetical protein
MVQNFQIHSKSKQSRVIRDSTLRNNSTLTQMHLTYFLVHGQLLGSTNVGTLAGLWGAMFQNWDS